MVHRNAPRCAAKRRADAAQEIDGPTILMATPLPKTPKSKAPFRVLPTLFILLWLIAIMVFWWTGVSRCQNEVLSEVWSPDGQVRASLFKHSCRGEPDSGGVSVGRRVTSGTAGPGNVLRFPVSGLTSVSIRWESRRVLVVRHPASLPIAFRATTAASTPWRVAVREEPW